jgi:ADP-heptose:LPS heptosyltransferase
MRIGIVSLDALGDQVIRTGFVRACREFWPDAELTMICTGKTSEFWRLCPWLGGVAEVDKADNIAPSFDMILNPRPAPDYYGASAFIAINKPKSYIGFDVVPPTRPLEPAWLAPYRLLERLGYRGEHYKPEMDVKAQDGFRTDVKLIAVGIGAEVPHKIWPTRFFARALSEIDKAGKFGFILLGNKSDRNDSLHSPDWPLPIWDLVGNTSILRMASILKRCSLFIGNDSAPKHIAAALGVPVVEVSWINCPDRRLDYDRVFGPVGVPFKIVRPERVFTYEETLAGDAVRSINVERVIEAARSLLSG